MNTSNKHKFTCRKVFAPGALLLSVRDSNGNRRISNTMARAKNNDPPSPVCKQE